MGKVHTCAVMQNIVEEGFACMTEGGMTDIVAKSDGFYQVGIKPQCASDGAGDPADELNVEEAAGDIVIFIKGKDLGLIGIAVVVGAMHDLVDIPHEGGAPGGMCIVGVIASAGGKGIIKSISRGLVLGNKVYYLFGGLFVARQGWDSFFYYFLIL